MAAGRQDREALRPLRDRRTLTRDCRTPSAYPPRPAPYLPPNAESRDTSAWLAGLAFADLDGGVYLGLADGEFGGVLAFDPLGDVLVVAHQGLQVGPGGVEHPEVGV